MLLMGAQDVSRELHFSHKYILLDLETAAFIAFQNFFPGCVRNAYEAAVSTWTKTCQRKSRSFAYSRAVDALVHVHVVSPLHAVLMNCIPSKLKSTKLHLLVV